MIDGSGVERAAGAPRVRVAGLTYEYRRGHAVLDAIDFDVRAGQVVGVLGRNGSGKTTLLRLLAGILEPTAGHIDLAGRPAFVTDRTPFLESLTARENIRGVLALGGVGAFDASALAESRLREFELMDDADRPVREFSLGMRRRLALAEGIAASRPVVLLDEPTMGLDPGGRDRLKAVLRDLASGDAAIVMASNDAAFVERVCDSVILLNGGRIVARGRPAEMIARLRAPTLLEITTAGSPPEAPPPEGLAVVARSGSRLTLSAAGATGRLPEVWSWLEATGCTLRELRIREPGLADVFRAHTGEELEAPRASA